MSAYFRINSATVHDADQSPQHPDTTSNLRIVSEQECNALKRNITLLLQEQNETIYQSFNRHDFAIIFKQILPNSDDAEIVKLFNYVDGQKHENIKTVSFDGILNKSRNFRKLLHSMCCELDNNHDSDTDSNTDTDTDSQPLPSGADINRISKLLPQLSSIQVYQSRGADGGSSSSLHFLSPSPNKTPSMECVNTNNYTEYIKYQKEQITDLKNTIAKLQRHETKCNELQFMLDTKCKMIDNLKEEIKQLNIDKDEYMNEVHDIREHCNEIAQKICHLNEYQKTHDSEQQSNVLMQEKMQHIKNEFDIRKKKSIELQLEIKHLSEMNQQFTKINEHLRNELQNEKGKIIKLKELTDLKDDEIRRLTVEILNKDHAIQQLQKDNEDLSAQLNYASGQSEPVSTASTTKNQIHSFQETVDWRNVEFDLFQDFENTVKTKRNTMGQQAHHTMMSSGGFHDFSIMLTESNFSSKRYNENEAIKEEPELEYENSVLLHKIEELQAELQRNKETPSQFWPQCIRNLFD